MTTTTNTYSVRPIFGGRVLSVHPTREAAEAAIAHFPENFQIIETAAVEQAQAESARISREQELRSRNLTALIREIEA